MNRTINGLSNKTSWCFRIISRNCQLETSASRENRVFVKPKIPHRIKRSSTDLLKAIATTVARDPTGPQYKYHDDPYMIPISPAEKRNYALSKESGKKAARWIRDNHGELYNHNPDDPIIKDFLPKIKFDENSEISELDLQTCINRFQVLDAINVYKLCQGKNIELSVDTRQALLELVSFYNGKDSIDLEWVEEKKNEPMPKMVRNARTWKNNSLAEELFEELKENGVKPYCAIIRGLCTHGHSEKAWTLYQEALTNNLTLDTETFNALIKISASLNDDNFIRWQYAEEILHKMIEKKIRPNLGTLNSLLDALVWMRSWAKTQSLSLQALTEFMRLDIEPCLTTYYYLLKIHYTPKHINNILPSILREIENKFFTVKDLKDDMFFWTAMEICEREINSFEDASRLHNFLMKGNHFNFLGTNIKYAVYFRNYFKLCVRSLPFDEFLFIYEDLTPHLYSPDRETMEEIIKAIGILDDMKLLARIWSDCLLFEVGDRESVISLTLKTMSQHKLEDIDSSLAMHLTNIVWDMWERFQKRADQLLTRDQGRQLEWTGDMFGDCLNVLSRCREPEKALLIFNKLSEEPSLMLGVIPFQSLKYLVRSLVEYKMYSEAVNVLKYCKDEDLSEDYNLAKEFVMDPTVPKDVKNKLVAMYGESITK